MVSFIYIVYLSVFFSILLVTNSEKMILSFNSKECHERISDVIISLNQSFKEIIQLHHLKMIIIEYESEREEKIIQKIHKNYKNDCINLVEKDEIIKLNLPKTKYISEDDERISWHLKRINVEKIPLPTEYTRRIEYDDVKTHVFIIDTGIDANHPELKEKISPKEQNFSFVKIDSCCLNNCNAFHDCNSHGTHCAGLVASEIAGYNPNAILHSIKVCNFIGHCTISNILEGINKAIDIKKAYFIDELTIASISLGLSMNIQINQAIEAAFNNKIFIVVAAGNENTDACTKSPSSSEYAFTVGATNLDDERSSFSNYGDCVAIFAPGSEIYSTIPVFYGSHGFKSGTSMSSPIVAGFASAIGGKYKITDPLKLKEEVMKHMSKDVISDSLSKNNYFIYDGK